MPSSSAAEQVEGTLLVVGAACVFALVALVVKVDPLSLLVATELRFLVSWAVAIAFMLMFKSRRGLHWFGPPELRAWLMLKCVCSFAFITLWWAALRLAPVGDCIAIVYCSPVLTSLFSKALLGEALPRRFLSRIVLVSAGCLLVLDPPFLHSYGSGPGPAGPADAQEEDIMPRQIQGYFLVFLALLMASWVPVVTRKAKDCSWIEVEHVSACLASLFLDPGLVATQYMLYGVVPSLPEAAPREITLILLAALGAFVGIAMETKGYQLAEPGKATLFRYIEVPFAYVLQKLGTMEPVRAQAILGSVLIISSCLLGLGDNGPSEAEPKAEKVTDEKKEALLADKRVEVA